MIDKLVKLLIELEVIRPDESDQAKAYLGSLSNVKFSSPAGFKSWKVDHVK